MTFATTRILPISALALPVSIAAPRAAAAQDANQGAQVYDAHKCQTCHSIAGKSGEANTLDGVGAKLSADLIRAWIVDPIATAKKSNSTKKPPMPNRYNKLPAADVDALVAYMQTL